MTADTTISERVSAVSRRQSEDIVPRLVRVLNHFLNMAAERVIFDPDGDLLLRLTYTPEKKQKNTSAFGAFGTGGLFRSVPASSSASSNLGGGLFGNVPTSSSTPSNLGSGLFGSRPPAPNTTLFANPNSTPLDTSSASSSSSASLGTSTPAGFGASSTPTPESDGQSVNEEEVEVIKEVEMLVSAKHLMLASPVFKAMFKHDFVEGETLRATGKVEVALPDDDTTAMEIVLNIIHGRVRQVPKQLTLDVVTALSIIVDKYRMHEVVELYVELWIAHLKPSMPKYYSQDLYKWLSVAWVFKLPDIFKHISWISARETYAGGFLTPPPDPSLPIPEPILAEIGELRRKAISDALSIIAQLKDKLTGPGSTVFGRPKATTRVCISTFGNIDIDNKRYSCEGMILGTLLKGLSDKMLWPPPAHPYPYHSFKGIAMSIRSIKITSLCDTMQETANYKSPAGFTFASSIRSSRALQDSVSKTSKENEHPHPHRQRSQGLDFYAKEQIRYDDEMRLHSNQEAIQPRVFGLWPSTYSLESRY
ncbi:uncharacterized protein PAC_10448 [Phialocephala subalpina]|uniref:BTB domain-containing protein n=1 Tax=Phialocephala subalpina TaxID=576137 RepID=A0A1L7X6B9_9HELO|nr:uncharacterized protein PAC_10448 [Phialocephala subalpina]